MGKLGGGGVCVRVKNDKWGEGVKGMLYDGNPINIPIYIYLS